MDALVMCGGRGSRYESAIEKPLVEIGGVPMIDRVLEAFHGSAVDTVYAVTSPQAPDTGAHVDVATIETLGEGYVTDLRGAVDRVGHPVVTAAADLPLLAPDVIDTLLNQFDGHSLALVVPTVLKRHLGLDVDNHTQWQGRTVTPTGVNVVAGSNRDRYVLTHDVRAAVNVNRESDVAIAEALL